MARVFFFFSSRRRHTRFDCDWSSDVCSSDLERADALARELADVARRPGIEVPHHIRELPRQRVRPLDLRLRWPTVVEHDVAVQIGAVVPQPLLALDHAALVRRPDLLPHPTPISRSATEPLGAAL